MSNILELPKVFYPNDNITLRYGESIEAILCFPDETLRVRIVNIDGNIMVIDRNGNDIAGDTVDVQSNI